MKAGRATVCGVLVSRRPERGAVQSRGRRSGAAAARVFPCRRGGAHRGRTIPSERTAGVQSRRGATPPPAQRGEVVPPRVLRGGATERLFPAETVPEHISQGRPWAKQPGGVERIKRSGKRFSSGGDGAERWRREGPTRRSEPKADRAEWACPVAWATERAGPARGVCAGTARDLGGATIQPERTAGVFRRGGLGLFRRASVGLMVLREQWGRCLSFPAGL